MNQRTKIAIACSFMLLILVSWVVLRSKKPEAPPSPSIAGLFEERHAQAKTKLESPLGKLVLAKNWSVLQEHASAPDFTKDLADLTRSMFIELKFGDWVPSDYDQLSFLLVKNLSKLQEADQERVVIQVERLPPPAPTSPAKKTLRELFGSENPRNLRILAFKKLVIQEASPEAIDIQDAISLILSPPKRKGEINPAYLIEDARDPHTRKTLLNHLAGRMRRENKELTHSNLLLLARNISEVPHFYSTAVQICQRALQSRITAHIEYALRAVVFLNQFKKLPPTESSKIIKLLTQIPLAQQTPYNQEKLSEVIKLLGH